jgi:hypothetical protein
MTAEFQTLIALAVVAVAATWLLSRVFAKKKSPGCGSDCSCPSAEIKAKLKPGQPPA